MATKKIKRNSVAKAKAPAGYEELGSTGVKRTGQVGLIFEEFLRELQGDRAIKVYREMRDNDSVIGAMFFAIEMLVRQVKWRVEGEKQEIVDFVESCTQDMSTSWEDLICEILSSLTFGWSFHEVVYKKRQGPDQTDPSKRSRFNDGKIGWRKIPIRAQDTLVEWKFDDEGGIQAFIQSAPPNYERIEIPIERGLLFRTGQYKGSPEGRSLLRNVYRSWYMKRRIEEIEAIGIERDLAGIPVFYRTADLAAKYDTKLEEVGRNLKRDEQECLILPLIMDENGQKLLTFELLTSGGKRQLDVSPVIERYDKRIAMTVLADFLLLGQQSVGSFALVDSRTELFGNAVGAILQTIATVFNRVAIPRLLSANGMPLDDVPQLVPGDVESPNLKDLGGYITALAGAGAPLFPDDDLEAYLRSAANLPPKSEASARLAAPTEPGPKKKPQGQEVPPDGQPTSKPPVSPNGQG